MKAILGSILALASLVSGDPATDALTDLAPLATLCPGAASLTTVVPLIKDPNVDDFEAAFADFTDPLGLFGCVADHVLEPPSTCVVDDIPTSVDVQTCVANFIQDQLSSTTVDNFITALVGDGAVTSDNTGSDNTVLTGDPSVFESCTVTLGTYGCTMLLSDEERDAITAPTPDPTIAAHLECIYHHLNSMITILGYDPFGTFDIVSLISDLPSGVNASLVETCSEDPETSAYYQSLAVRRTSSPTTGAASIQAYTLVPALATLGVAFLHF